MIYMRWVLGIACVLGALPSWSQQDQDSLEYKVYRYESGQKSSEGYLSHGQPTGYWKSYYRNGVLKSEGLRRDYQLDSLWTFYNRDGEKIVEITYSKGAKHGPRKTYADGRLNKMEPFVAGRIHGDVRYFYADSSLRKKLPFQEGQKQGTGYEYARDGRVITLLTFDEGTLKRKQEVNRYDQQQQKQGVWLQFHTNEQVKQEGTYQNNLKHGYWKYYNRQGDLLRVEKWLRGELQEGATEVEKVDIRREIDPQTGKLSYKGAFRQDKPVGLHRWYDEEGNVDSSVTYVDGKVLYRGIVDKQGRKQGPWEYYYPGGALKAKGSYKNDFKIGNWNYYYRNGQLEQRGRYIRGNPDGLWTWYHSTGQVWREEEYVMGAADGSSVEYNDTGAVIAQGKYVQDLREGDWVLQVNDHREVGSYFEGQRTGVWKHYYLSTGNLRFEGRYENGLESGQHRYYYPNGNLKLRGTYVAGKRDGVWEYFDRQGNRRMTITYEDGEEITVNGDPLPQNTNP